MSTIRYLNSRNKRNMLLLSMIHCEMEQMIDSFKLDGLWKKKATQMKNDATKIMKHVTEGLDAECGRQVKRAISHFKIDVVQTSKLSKDHEENSDRWFMNIVEVALGEHCTKCTKLGDDVETCELREAFVHGSVPVYDECAPKGVCPYQMIE